MERNEIAEINDKVDELLKDNAKIMKLLKTISEAKSELPPQPNLVTKVFRNTNTFALENEVNEWLKGVGAKSVQGDKVIPDKELGGVIRTVTVDAERRDEFDE